MNIPKVVFAGVICFLFNADVCFGAKTVYARLVKKVDLKGLSHITDLNKKAAEAVKPEHLKKMLTQAINDFYESVSPLPVVEEVAIEMREDKDALKDDVKPASLELNNFIVLGRLLTITGTCLFDDSKADQEVYATLRDQVTRLKRRAEIYMDMRQDHQHYIKRLVMFNEVSAYCYEFNQALIECFKKQPSFKIAMSRILPVN